MNKQWTLEEAKEIFEMPFMDLIYKAQIVHRQHFNPNKIQMGKLLNVKTGACPENCSYCPQSIHNNTGLKVEQLMKLEDVITKAKEAKEVGATRFCIGAAWRSPTDRNLDKICEMVKEIKKLGLESCVTLGLLKDNQAEKLKEAGVDFYNHNIDTSEEYYDKIITTRNFEDRLNTLEKVRTAGLKICCGGIIGMGETNEDRISMLVTLANLESPPESVPINRLIKTPGLPLENQPEADYIDFVRVIALARILMPNSYVRLTAGRKDMPDEVQALCFLAGANSIFHGDKYLVLPNMPPKESEILLNKLGLEVEA